MCFFYLGIGFTYIYNKVYFETFLNENQEVIHIHVM